MNLCYETDHIIMIAPDKFVSLTELVCEDKLVRMTGTSTFQNGKMYAHQHFGTLKC